MKKRFLSAAFIALLAVGSFSFAACDQSGETGYAVSITNKAEIQEEWHVKDASRTLEVSITKDGETQNPSAAIAAGELTVESSNTNAVLAGGLVLTIAGEGETTITVKYHGWSDSVNITALAELPGAHDWVVGESYYFGFDVGTNDYYYATGVMQSSYVYRGAITKSSADAVKVTVTEGSETNGYYLSFELNGEVNYIVIQKYGEYMDLLYVPESEKSMLYWNESVGAFFDDSRTCFLCYNSSYKCLYGSSYSSYPNSPIATLYPDADIETLYIDSSSSVLQGSSLTLSTYALPVGAYSGATYAITAQVNASNETVENIATLEGNVLKGVNPGTVTITATSTENSEITATMDIEVLNPGEKVEVKSGKFGLYQQTNKAYYYFTGEMSGNYGKLSKSYTDGVDVTLLKDNYYYYISFQVNGETKYVGNDPESTGHFKIHDDPFALIYDEKYGAFETSDGAYYVGNYSTYDTLSWSAVSYLGQSGQNVATIYESEPGEVEEDAPVGAFTQVETPVSGSSYYLGFPDSGLMYLFNGTTDSWGDYLLCTNKVGEAVQIVVTAKDEGKYGLTFTLNETEYTIYAWPSKNSDGTKQYGEITFIETANLSNAGNDAVSAFEWDSTNATFKVTLTNGTWYLSTYAQYGEISLTSVENSYSASHLYTYNPDYVEETPNLELATSLTAGGGILSCL